ncbi:MAG: DUF3995 domain-containing protein [Bacteroidota bacterium]
MQLITYILGITVSVLLIGIGLLHVYWALGGRWGIEVAVPEIQGKAAFAPSILATVFVAIALLAAAGIVLGRLGVWGSAMPSWVFYWGTWALASVFLIRSIGNFRLIGFFKKVTGTRFAQWDTFLFSPLCLFIALVLILVALT